MTITYSYVFIKWNLIFHWTFDYLHFPFSFDHLFSFFPTELLGSIEQIILEEFYELEIDMMFKWQQAMAKKIEGSTSQTSSDETQTI